MSPARLPRLISAPLAGAYLVIGALALLSLVRPHAHGPEYIPLANAQNEANSPSANLALAQRARDILKLNCLPCHNGYKYKANDRDSITAVEVTPGDPDNSPLYEKITGNFGPLMPQGGYQGVDGQRLPADQMAVLHDWIAAGAPDWSGRINPVDGAAMVFVPPGPFTMGSDDGEADEKPVRRVILSGFWIDKNPVTVAQYQRFCAATHHAFPTTPAGGWGQDRPITGVSWDDAIAYCAWAGAALPTEAQWEKAARGPDGLVYPWGNAFDPAKLWCSKAASADAKTTAPAGSFPAGASPYGCLDLAGNVREWCADWYGPYDPGTLKDPAGPSSGTARVVRGGSWAEFAPGDFRAAKRTSASPASATSAIGFRCVQAG